jgi:hypothetical protein
LLDEIFGMVNYLLAPLADKSLSSVFSEFFYMLNRRSPDAAPSIRIAPGLRRSVK